MTDTVTLPALIDCHVHFREPGLTHKATMKSEAAAALAGGVHTVCEMPNTIPPTNSVAALADKVRRSAGFGVDMRFFFGITEAVHIVTLKELWTSTGEELRRLKGFCSGVKAYLDHSTGNQKIEESLVEELFAACGQLDIPLVAHCEDPVINAAAKLQVENMMKANPALKLTGDNTVALHSAMRPAESELSSVDKAIALAEKHKTPLHVAHLSTAGALDRVRGAKAMGLRVTCEVSPHHLFLTVEDYPALGTFGKMNPPLRMPADRDALWLGVADGTVDCIATDHAPHTLEEKANPDPLAAPSGVPGVETMLPLLLTVAAGKWPNPQSSMPTTLQRYRLRLEDIERLCFTNPNHIFRLGKDPNADRISIDPAAEWTVRGTELHSLCGWTPFEGWKMTGSVLNSL